MLQPCSRCTACRDMIAQHNTPRCSLGGSTALEEFPDVLPGAGAQSGGEGAANGSSSFSGSVEGLPSQSGAVDCDFCGPPHGISGNGAEAPAPPPIVAGPFDGDALMA
jgi:hypothetical protein